MKKILFIIIISITFSNCSKKLVELFLEKSSKNCKNIKIDETSFRLNYCNLNFSMNDNKGNISEILEIIPSDNSVPYQFKISGHTENNKTYVLFEKEIGKSVGSTKLNFELNDNFFNSQKKDKTFYSGQIKIEITAQNQTKKLYLTVFGNVLNDKN